MAEGEMMLIKCDKVSSMAGSYCVRQLHRKHWALRPLLHSYGNMPVGMPVTKLMQQPDTFAQLLIVCCCSNFCHTHVDVCS